LRHFLIRCGAAPAGADSWVRLRFPVVCTTG
jgi:hypothetical protein